MDDLMAEESGFFWWSDVAVPVGQYAPDGAVAGRFKIKADGLARVELEGFLPNPFGAMAALADDANSLSSRAIHGVLKLSNKCVRMLELSRAGGTFKSNGISFEKFAAHQCLVSDGPFKDIAGPLQFNTLSIPLQGFEEWLRLGSICVEHGQSETIARHTPMERIDYPLAEGALAIEYGMRGPMPGTHRDFKVSWTEFASLQYVLNLPASLESLKNQYGLVTDLFILLTGSDFNLSFPILTAANDQWRFEFYFQRHLSDATEIRWPECWTNFPQLRGQFGDLYALWQRRREELGPAIYLYLGTLRSMTLYQEHRFVNLIWGLESLHRRRGSNDQPASPLSEKIGRILAQVENSDDRHWLKGKLKHAAEPPLELRLFESLRDLPLALEEKALRAFCTECATRRNEISHFGGQRHENRDYGNFVEALYKTSEALSYLYHVLLLQEVGVPIEILKFQVYKGPFSFRIREAFVDVGLLQPESLHESTAKAGPT
jgi:hypothetical protein